MLAAGSGVECTTPTIIESKRLNIENSLKQRKTPPPKKEFLELAEACEEAADKIDDCRASG